MDFPKRFKNYADFTKAVGDLIDITYGAFVIVYANIMALKFDKDPRGYMESTNYNIIWFNVAKFLNQMPKNHVYCSFGADASINSLVDPYKNAVEMIYNKHLDAAAVSQEVFDYFSANYKS